MVPVGAESFSTTCGILLQNTRNSWDMVRDGAGLKALGYWEQRPSFVLHAHTPL